MANRNVGPIVHLFRAELLKMVKSVDDLSALVGQKITMKKNDELIRPTGLAVLFLSCFLERDKKKDVLVTIDQRLVAWKARIVVRQIENFVRDSAFIELCERAKYLCDQFKNGQSIDPAITREIEELSKFVVSECVEPIKRFRAIVNEENISSLIEAKDQRATIIGQMQEEIAKVSERREKYKNQITSLGSLAWPLAVAEAGGNMAMSSVLKCLNSTQERLSDFGDEDFVRMSFLATELSRWIQPTINWSVCPECGEKVIVSNSGQTNDSTFVLTCPKCNWSRTASLSDGSGCCGICGGYGITGQGQDPWFTYTCQFCGHSYEMMT